MKRTIGRELLHGYLEDSLSEGETAQVEQALRESEPLRRQLRAVMQERDRGEHTLGAIWRRQRLSCPTREQLGSYLLQALEPGHIDYIEFHLRIIDCPFCQANLTDLQAQQDSMPKVKKRRQRIFDSSAGLLHSCRQAKS